MEEVKKYLINNIDKKYLDFSENLNICKGIRSLGVRIPILRDFAKSLSKKYSLDYLIKNIDEEYYEEILLKGFIIGNYRNLAYDELTNYLDNHLEKIIDWSMCDTFATSLKITNMYLDRLWPYLLNKLKSEKEFVVRFAIVMMLNYYINDDYKDKIYKVILSIKSDKYYVKMAISWLISYMFINYFDDTINFIKHNKLDNWIIKKGITKAIESFRINNEQKKVLKKIRDYINEHNTL